jgi:hypothetical protein
MKVFALGGYGEVGLPAIKLLAQSDLVTEIAVAGRNLELAEKAAMEVGKKGIAVCVDGTDEEKLTALLVGYNIIMNSAMQNSIIPAIQAAMQNGAHYCDAASFGDVVEQVLQLASEAKTAGITAVIATGISPCISNLMGVHVARQLDEVEQLQVGRADIFSWESKRDLMSRQQPKEPAESLVALRECRSFIAWMLKRLQKEGIRSVLDYRDDQWVEVDPTMNGLEVPLAQSVTNKIYPYFSGVDVWGQLPRDLSNQSPVEISFSPLPPQLHKLLREHAQGVLTEDIDPDASTNSFFEAIERDPQRWLTYPDDFALIPKMWVRAVGHKEGRAARYTSWFTAPMWNVGGWFLTSVSLAVAVLKILRGEVQERGIMHAETAFEPQSFLNEVAAMLPEPPPDGRLIGESFEWLE